MFDWLRRTVQVAAALPDVQLVIRVHPAEVRIPMSESRDRAIDRLEAEFPDLPPNVRLVSDRLDRIPLAFALARHARRRIRANLGWAFGFNSVGIDLAKAVLVYTSTIGLEAAVRGKRVLVAGRTHYRGRGFTSDVASREDYRDLLLESLQGDELGAAEVELARRYAYLFFFRFMQDFPWVVDTPRSARRLTFSHLSELAVGRNPVLDRMCEAILEGRPFISFDPQESLPDRRTAEPA